MHPRKRTVPSKRLRRMRQMQRIRNVIAATAILAGLAAAPMFAQAPPSFAPAQLDQLVARIALYPDPLLAQILAAATYPNDIPAAAQWADQHHYLTGQALADAITGGPAALGSQRAGAASVSLRAGHDEFGHELDHADRQRIPGAAAGRDGRRAAAARRRATLRLSANQRPDRGERRAVHYDPARESGLYCGPLL